jgi:Ca2+-binding RTX toxin-like protein
VSRPVWLARIGLTLLTTASVGVLAAPAQAATNGVVSVVDTTKVQYKAKKGQQNKVVVTRAGRTITVDDRVALKAGKGCKAVKGDKTKIRCTPKKAPTRVSVYTYDRNDSVVNQTDLPMTADGGTGNDKLTGGPRGDRLAGGNGADRVYGLGGGDHLDGGPGNDLIHAGAGSDTVMEPSGNFSGNDVIYGEAGADTLFAESGNDKVYGGNDGDLVLGGAGNDWLDGGWGDDTLVGDDDGGGPSVKGGITADVLLGGPGLDTVDYSDHVKNVTVDLDGAYRDDGQAGEHDTVGSDVESLTGGYGNDRLTGNRAANWIYGWRGNDTIRGGAGNDWLSGDDGRDALYGEAGDDTLSGVDLDRNAADRLDGGVNATAGDTCEAHTSDTKVNCEH